MLRAGKPNKPLHWALADSSINLPRGTMVFYCRTPWPQKADISIIIERTAVVISISRGNSWASCVPYLPYILTVLMSHLNHTLWLLGHSCALLHMHVHYNHWQQSTFLKDGTVQGKPAILFIYWGYCYVRVDSLCSVACNLHWGKNGRSHICHEACTLQQIRRL